MKRIGLCLGFSLLAIFFIAFGCKEPQKPESVFYGKGKSIVIADTITYDINLRAFDTTDYWDVEYHRYIKHELFADYFFDGLYMGLYHAFDFDTGKPLSVKDIKKVEMEEGFSRSKVTKVQIKELWLVDSSGVFQRLPYSYTLGLELYSKQGNFLGHRALFVVKPSSQIIEQP